MTNTRESLRDEPVTDADILEQNMELMDAEFPDELMEDWYQTVVPTIRDILATHKQLSDEELRLKSHKCAGSALQVGGHQLGTALRSVSHLIQSGSREIAEEILEDVPEYLAAFEKAISDSKQK